MTWTLGHTTRGCWTLGLAASIFACGGGGTGAGETAKASTDAGPSRASSQQAGVAEAGPAESEASADPPGVTAWSTGSSPRSI
jgi:hypothetical protein